MFGYNGVTYVHDSVVRRRNETQQSVLFCTPTRACSLKLLPTCTKCIPYIHYILLVFFLRAQPKEMFCTMPIMCVKGVAADRVDTQGIYMCPVYKTEQRGPTYVFSAQLKTKSPAGRWVLAGVALIMDAA